MTEQGEFAPRVRRHALATRVLAVATTRAEGTWTAYIDAVPGEDHRVEQYAVLLHGTKLSEEIARVLFPSFDDVPYAD